ncbi:PDZ domain-containing protein [Thermohalobacter berrensis]|uniref:PDZ domain-containing protein n=1 Tax=Thermohalobacter berrensis TaxID=99594 RepID=A0A419SXV6_9FIRM|nr:PDZ domain-containing protein [Thermohalobacter berrensis]RKD30092.1 hypothetical protein BET03_05140 [Thermohalobacter berrensis]
MSKLFDIIYMSGITLFQLFINPIYWGVVLLLYFQYKRVAKMEKRILGTNKEPIHKRVLSSMLMGILGGIIGSFVILLLGITIEANDFKYVFLLAILLMLFHPRFICFSYAGGIISLSSLLFGYPKVNVSSIIAIVAVLHLVESFLILLDGDNTLIPIFMKKNNRVVGGFNMMRFWPIPFIVLLIIGQMTVLENGVNMPEWWPLFKPDGVLANQTDLTFYMIAVIAVLGYGDMSITDYPKNKIKNSSKNLFLFSIILLILAVLSSHIYVFKYIAALFSPIAHEALIQYGRKREREGTPVFLPSHRGVKVLDVIPNSVGEKLGLKSGDIILSINGERVYTKREIDEILSYYPTFIWVDYYSNGEVISKDYANYRKGVRNLGVLVISNDEINSFIVKELESPIKRILKKIKRKLIKRS